jgi:hypothetical protein
MRLRDGRLAGLSIIKTMSAAHVDHETLKEVRAMATELRERRAADLTSDEVEALKWLHEVATTLNRFGSGQSNKGDERTATALEVLERLTKGSE